MRAALPPQVLHEFKHLALDFKKPVQELLVDGAILLLRFHERGQGLPEPEPPKPSSSAARTSKKGARKRNLWKAVALAGLPLPKGVATG